MAAANTVSCVVPVYNGALYLEEAVASIEAQTWGTIEIIVVDDGSTDDTPRVIERLGGRVRALRQDNTGGPAARDAGLAAASGSFLTFLDADDLWLPEKTAAQMARFDARPELDVCMCRAEHFWIPELEQEAGTMSRTLNEAGVGAFPALMARRRIFEKTGPLDRRLRHLDLAEWLMRVADEGGVVENLEAALLRRRLHFTNTSRQRGTREAEERLIIARTRLERMRRA